MGQKINPNIFRLGINKTWNNAFFEQKNSELAFYTFKNLELKKYIQKFLINNKLVLHDYKFNYNKSVLNIYISYFIPVKTKEYKIKNNKCENLHIFNEKFLINKFIKGLALFTKKNYKIIATFQCINKKIYFLTPKQINFIKKKLILLRRYKKDEFNFDETFNLLLTALLNKNSSFIISYYIANKLKFLKKHNRFIKCIKKILVLLLKSQLCSFKGIQIKINGKINRARRTKEKIIKIGTLPIQTISSKVSYAQESKTHNPNGSLGVKVWIIEK